MPFLVPRVGVQSSTLAVYDGYHAAHSSLATSALVSRLGYASREETRGGSLAESKSSQGFGPAFSQSQQPE